MVEAPFDFVDVLNASGDMSTDHEKDVSLQFYLDEEKQAPNDASIQYKLSIIYRNLKKSLKSIEHSTQAVRLKPQEKKYVLNAVEILVENIKYGQAESILKRYLKTNSGCKEGERALADLQKKLTNGFEEDIRMAEKQQFVYPQTKYIQEKLASIESFIGFMKGEEIPKYPLDIFLEVSNVCDLKCIMCGTFSAINPLRHTNISGTTRGFLDYKVLEPIDELLKHALKVHCFGYGEPTLNPKFKEFIHYISQYEVVIDFFTNGMHLTDDLVRFLVDNAVGDITVSFSGSTKVEYESAYQGGKFEQVLEGLARIRDYKKATGKIFPRVSINSLAYRHHLHTFDSFVGLMAEHGVSVIYLKPLLECGDYLPDLVGQSELITPEINDRVIKQAIKIAVANNVGLSIAPELYVHSSEEEYKRHIEFSGLPKDEYAKRKSTIPIEQYKELAKQTKQIPRNDQGPDVIIPVDIENGNDESIRNVLNVGHSEYAHGENYHFYCMEPFKTMYILENGETKPCCNVPSYSPPLGNVINYGGEKVWNGKGFNAYRNAIMNEQYPLTGCANCLKFKTGPKTHFVDQMVREYFVWHSKIHHYTVSQHLAIEIAHLGDGSAIVKRFATK
jgi:MoaA/NifB/PqqE/SkfB family radical SAM enzyme